MKLWAKLVLGGLGLTSTSALLTIWLSYARWNSKTSQFVDNLKQSIPRRETRKVSFDDFNNLPTPVAKYFRLVLKDGQPFITLARIKHRGEFRLGDNWIPFESEQHFASRPSGFVWDADMQMNSLMNVRVRDSYVAGRGTMQAKILSLVTMMDAHDKPELDTGALQRYLAEIVWLPTSLLPGEGVKWSVIDESRALATLTDSGITVSLEFRFNETGEITSVFTPEHYREVNGQYELASWCGYFRSYEERGGMRIPIEGEVEWQLPSGNLPYWKGQIVEVEYDFAP